MGATEPDRRPYRSEEYGRRCVITRHPTSTGGGARPGVCARWTWGTEMGRLEAGARASGGGVRARETAFELRGRDMRTEEAEKTPQPAAGWPHQPSGTSTAAQQRGGNGNGVHGLLHALAVRRTSNDAAHRGSKKSHAVRDESSNLWPTGRDGGRPWVRGQGSQRVSTAQATVTL